MNGHLLVKMAHMFDRIDFTIIDGESRLVKAARELGLLNTLRKWGARYLKETFPIASCPWPFLGGVLDLLQ